MNGVWVRGRYNRLSSPWLQELEWLGRELLVHRGNLLSTPVGGGGGGDGVRVRGEGVRGWGRGGDGVRGWGRGGVMV